MVAAVSKEPAHVVEWDIPLAQGLQYQAIFLQLRDRPVVASAPDPAAPDWRAIAGL